jgi:predicted extracellular nuclease
MQTLRTALLTLTLSSLSFAQGGMRITEYMYQGANGEFVEFTNTSAAPIDLAGWSFDDDSRVAGTVDLSGAGVVAPGASVLLVEGDPVAFAAAWGLSSVVIGPNGAAIGRNDELNLFDAGGNLVDRLTYGDEDFPGTHRARNISHQACDGALGRNDIYRWSAAVVGDAWSAVSSLGNDVGSPGTYVVVACPTIGAVYCLAQPNSTGTGATLVVVGSSSVAANDVTLTSASLPLNSLGYYLTSTTQGSANPPGSQGTLCLGGSIGRYSTSVLSSGSLGEVALQLDVTALATPNGPAAAMAGETWSFQYWYRDANPTSTSNFSVATQVTWQ